MDTGKKKYHRFGSRHGNRDQATERSRERPLIKASTILGWMAPNLRAPDLEEAGRAAPGPPHAQKPGRAHLWRDSPTDDTMCQGAKAALQFLMETMFSIDLTWALQQEAARQLTRAADGSLPLEARAAAADAAEVARNSWVELRRFPRSRFDLALCTQTASGVRRLGLALQTRVPKMMQHYKLEQKERVTFKEQSVEGGLGVMFTGYHLAAATKVQVADAVAGH